MSEAERLLAYLEAHPECVKHGIGKYGKPSWLWRVGPDHYEPAFSLCTAILAAMEFHA